MLSSAVRPLVVARGGRFRHDSEPGADSVAGGGGGSATNLHGALSHRQDKNSTMRCQKKLHDALSVRSYVYGSVSESNRPRALFKPSTGFEDQGPHQRCKHSQQFSSCTLSCTCFLSSYCPCYPTRLLLPFSLPF